MNSSKARFLFILPPVYLLAVIVSIVQAFDYTGRIESDWVLVVIGLTLPWSIVTVFFMWALFHGAGLEFFTVLFLVFAVINAFIMFRISSAICKRYEKKNAG